MKAYTTIEQSKVLAEILPLESADMWWPWYSNLGSDGYYDDFPMFYKPICNPDKSVPCWSLGALISLLPKRYCLETLDNGTYVCYNFLSQHEKFGNTPIDAVYSMIIFLKEEKKFNYK